ncbi:MAG: GGDEF domain-containing protein [Xanthomonadales bacterium PRO6]|nr:hypothetical protein [Xanthomonadales bacterium]MCE7929802.1 GGDEF domain-containing protein [Xanthomonadales bacterium PRO6]
MFLALLALAAAGNAHAQSCASAEVRALLGEAARRPDGAAFDERRLRWTAIIEAHRACRDHPAEAQALADWAKVALDANQRNEALAAENARHSLAVRAGLERHRAESAQHVGILLMERGENDLAVRRLREAAQALEALGDWSQAADTHSRLSRWNRQSGDYVAALADEQAALAMRRRIEPPPNVWRSLLNLAVLYEQLELHEDSRRRYADALDEAEREGNEANVAVVLTAFAGYLNDFGTVDAAQALAMAERALAIVRRQGDPVQVASALLQTGRAHANLHHLYEADRAYVEGLQLATSASHRAMTAHLNLRHGELAMAQGHFDKALERIEAARVGYESTGNRHRLVKVYAALEELHQRRGDPLAAAQAGRERFRLRDELLGSKATGKLGELLSRFELTEERRRSERLEQEKAVAELTLVAQRSRLQLIYIVAAAIGLALLLLGWRHRTARRLYRLLHHQNQLVMAQAEQLSAANRQLTEQSQRLYRSSITDPLTQVHNRAYGMQRLEEWLAPDPGGRACASVILFDVDHFKAINDRHGHPVGDQVLVAVAQTMCKALPDSAELCRVGGEEFMALVDDDLLRPAVEVADRVRRAVQELQVTARGQRIDVTVSAGVCRAASLPERSAHRAYAAADTALYLAKGGGRNRVVLFGERPAVVRASPR